MRAIWRAQQSQAIISIVFWALTLTGIFYDKVAKKFNNFGLPESNVFGGMLIMFTVVVVMILSFGYLFDRFKFWKEQQIIAVERNPFLNNGKMQTNLIVYYRAIMDGMPKTRNTDVLRKMIEWNMEDPETRKEVNKIEQILGFDLE